MERPPPPRDQPRVDPPELDSSAIAGDQAPLGLPTDLTMMRFQTVAASKAARVKISPELAAARDRALHERRPS
jgi:hypothetical protein